MKLELLGRNYYSTLFWKSCPGLPVGQNFIHSTKLTLTSPSHIDPCHILITRLSLPTSPHVTKMNENSVSRATSGHNAVWTITWIQRNTPYSSALRNIWCSLRRRFLCAKSNSVCHCFLKFSKGILRFPRNLIDFALERNLAYVYLVEQTSQSLAFQDMLAHNKNSVKDSWMKA